MKLTIVIPAYNEADAIASIIERSLAAREYITTHAPVDEVEVIVVSDGSTDRTAGIAERYDDIRLITFERNRGYGAAIKRGFEAGTGELVGFLDADGTCDPKFFAMLCRAIAEEEASIAIGSRLGPDSRMPAVRRLGNRLYALILSALSNKIVTDTASGMRVIRRSALQQLYPLPDGLHFTPAMSARALMDEQLSIVERPMPYEERIGESKLHVVRDGMRFLRTILEMTLMWRPARLFIGCGAACLAVMVLLAMHPIEAWLRIGRLDQDTMYRLLFCSFLGTVGATLMSSGVISDHVHRLLRGQRRPPTFVRAVLDRCYSIPGVMVTTIAMLPALIWLVGYGVVTRVMDGYVDLHWSRVVLAGMLAFALVQMFVAVMIVNILRFHTARMKRDDWRVADTRRARQQDVVSRQPSAVPLEPSAAHGSA